ASSPSYECREEKTTTEAQRAQRFTEETPDSSLCASVTSVTLWLFFPPNSAGCGRNGGVIRGVNFYDLDTPALLVDLDRAERNISGMAEVARSGGKALRPHTKTHKTPEIASLQLRAGASGLTVAKLGEAEAFAD